MSVKLEETAKIFETIRHELEKAIQHADIAATHFRSQEAPRGCAHAIAIQGHLLNAQERMDTFSKIHTQQARKTV